MGARGRGTCCPLEEAAQGRLPSWMGLTSFLKRVETRLFQQVEARWFQRVVEVWAGCQDVGPNVSMTLVPTPQLPPTLDNSECNHWYQVCIHGLQGSVSSFDALLPRLWERGFRTLAFDLYGFGTGT